MIRQASLFTWFALLTLSVSSLAQAQTSQPSLPLDTQHCSFVGVFKQSKELKGLPQPLKSNGSFYYHCERGVIWRSEQPIVESLVFRKNGTAFTVDDQGEQNKVKSAQGKVLGRLLNDLIGGDLKELSKTFDLEQLNSNAVRFTPRKRRLKRALKVVDLEVKDHDSTTVEITIVDRNDQVTQVHASQKRVLEPALDTAKLLDQCIKEGAFSEQECLLVVGSDDTFSKN